MIAASSSAAAATGSHPPGWMSPAMLTLESVVSEIARTNIPILLVGEVGTGKQTFASRIHLLSRQCEKRMATVACASVKPETFDSELGVAANGKEAANAPGTILLDEISELDAACQRSLLYALPDGDATSRTATITARVISTTNKDLDAEMRAGRFRSELYYRISGVSLRLPPLRERREDIPMLAAYFLEKYSAEFGRARTALGAATLAKFREHSWPGNVRELENTVKKIVALGDEHLALAGFSAGEAERPVRLQAAPAGANYSLKAASRAASREAEREMILKALARTRWNRKRAAQELQISYKSLLYKLKQIGVPETEVS